MFNLGKNITFCSTCIIIILLVSVSVTVNTLSQSNAYLKQLHVLFRHGERSPTETYPNDPYKNFKWSGGWGHLTNKGKLQIYTLGQNLKNHYKDFLPELYWPQEVNVTSSYADRCLMSAEVINAGLFPPQKEQIWNHNLLWQPIPIHYLPRSQDTMIAMKAKCAKYDQMFKEVMASPKVQSILSANEKLMRYLSENTGMNVDTIGVVETLFNTLEIEQLNDLSLPSWINDTLMATMKELGAQNLALYSETEFMKKMKGGVLLKYIVTSMEKSLEGKTEPLVHLYSGHDLTVVHVLRALNLIDTIKPKFGAAVTFELYSEGEVKIFYTDQWNATADEQEIYSCKSPCQLSSWKQVLEPVLPTDWVEECKLKA